MKFYITGIMAFEWQVHDAVSRSDKVVFRCALAKGGGRRVELSAWTVDRAACRDAFGADQGVDRVASRRIACLSPRTCERPVRQTA